MRSVWSGGGGGEARQRAADEMMPPKNRSFITQRIGAYLSPGIVVISRLDSVEGIKKYYNSMESAMYPKHTVRITEWVSGVGNREQRLDLGFDPTKDFHSYKIFWNQC
ncbi:Xyloglucan endotransglucosylase/hydrolase protein 9 [Senna tora]|uniref:Xyloglucan endotransglucosylase/hydrolase protein 9 n=1 Tax=Senna tora TaxID=362788 RepID=A0A834W892_9FABA|nr:Xyloglucan endotransglucosylase/hydrolase protein 9 [Senna tora]